MVVIILLGGDRGLHAIKYKCPYLPMAPKNLRKFNGKKFRKLLYRVRCGEPVTSILESSQSMITMCESMVSGRFHATCLAFLLNKPVISIASNTHKIEELYYDAGISLTGVVGQNELNHKNPKGLLKLLKGDESKLIKAYVCNAKVKIHQMFKDISRI